MHGERTHFADGKFKKDEIETIQKHWELDEKELQKTFEREGKN